MKPEINTEAAETVQTTNVPAVDLPRLVRHSSWKDLESAPRDGTNIEGLYGDDVCLIRWAETRRCMLAGIGGGNGYFGAGWEDDCNGLIVDPPDAWREEDWESLPNS
jgi:hypothetical protein